MAKYTDEKAVTVQNESLRSLEQMSLSSRSPTRQYIVVCSQAIADQNFDMSKKFNSFTKIAPFGTVGVLILLYQMMTKFGP